MTYCGEAVHGQLPGYSECTWDDISIFCDLLAARLATYMYMYMYVNISELSLYIQPAIAMALLVKPLLYMYTCSKIAFSRF